MSAPSLVANGLASLGRIALSFSRAAFARIGLRPDRAAPAGNAGVAAARREIFGDSGGIAELAEDLEFPTPSAAAVFVLGGSQNGWTEWVSDDGETLNQVYRSEEN